MNQGCQGAVVEMTGMPSASQVVETGLVVSGVEADEHEVDLVVDDQALRHFRRAVGVRLAVLGDDFDWKHCAARA